MGKKDKASQLRADQGRELVKELHRLVKHANSAGVSIIVSAAYRHDEQQICRKLGMNLAISGLPLPTYAFTYNHLNDIFRGLQASSCNHTQRLGRNLQKGLDAMVAIDGKKYTGDAPETVTSPDDIKEDIASMLKKAADAVCQFELMMPTAVVGGTAPETLRKVADLALASTDPDVQSFGKSMAEAVDCMLPRGQIDAAYPVASAEPSQPAAGSPFQEQPVKKP